MGVVVAALNFKGGVGKTTVCAHLGWALCSHQGKKVLLVDLDPQMNLTQLFLTEPAYDELEEKGKTADRLFRYRLEGIPPAPWSRRGAPRAQDIAERQLRTTDGCLDIIPGSFEMVEIAINPDTNRIRDAQDMFIEFIASSSRFYDYIFMDLNAGASVLTGTAIEVADIMLSPVNNDAYSYKGVITLSEFIGRKYPRKLNSDREFFLLLLNAVSEEHMSTVSRAESRIRQNRVFSKLLLQNKVPESPLLQSDTMRKRGLFFDQRSSANADEYDRLNTLFRTLSEEFGARCEQSRAVST